MQNLTRTVERWPIETLLPLVTIFLAGILALNIAHAVLALLAAKACRPVHSFRLVTSATIPFDSSCAPWGHSKSVFSVAFRPMASV